MTQVLLFQDERRHLPKVAPPPDYRVPTRFPQIHAAKRIGIDLETHDPGIMEGAGSGARRGGYIVGVAISTEGFNEYYPMAHMNGPNCGPEVVLRWLREELTNFKGELVGANSNLYDGDYLQMAGVRPKACQWRDVQWAEALLDEHAHSYALEVLAQNYLDEHKGTAALEALYGKNCVQHIREIHPAHAHEYAIRDAQLPLRILDKQHDRLRRQQLLKLFDLECRLNPFLLYLRDKGVRVDLEAAALLEKKLANLRDEAVRKMNDVAGMEVDFNSNDSIARACDKLNIPYEHTEKGNPSFRKPPSIGMDMWIERQKHPLLKHVYTARMYEKQRGTFVEGYILNGHINGRLHCEFHPLRHVSEEGSGGTVSGRFASSNPNLQNIPIRTEIGKEIRALFLPEEGKEWAALDYNQTEFRLLVHVAVAARCHGAEVAQKMYRDDPTTDFHSMVASLTGLPRSSAKNQNFAIVYGQGIDAMAATLGKVDENGHALPEVYAMSSTYHERLPFVKQIYNMTMDTAKRRGYVKTLLGRRARFPKQERDFTYKALNRIIQGGAADLMKKAMLDLWNEGIIQNGFNASLTVHDELDGSVEPGDAGKKVLDKVKEIMENAIPLHVPVLTSCATGKNWSEAK